jgi:hypothetical protein
MGTSLMIREHDGRWCVSSHDDVEIVSFSGPGARERAERQQRELTQLLNSTREQLDSSRSTDRNR